MLLLQLALTVLSIFTHNAKAQSYGELRLAHRGNGSSPAPAAAGLLEIFLNGEWGTICDSGFDLIDAHVACRQMGYRAAISYTTAFHSPFSIGNQNQSVWLSDIDCRDPNGLHLLSCAHGEIGVHDSSTDCDHFFDVAVMCDKRPLPSSLNTSGGLLEDGSVRLSGGLHKSQGIAEIACGGEWRTVTACGDSASSEARDAQGTTSFSQKEANAICWQLGFTEASSYKIWQEIPVRDNINSSLHNQREDHNWYYLPPCTEYYQSCTFTCSNTDSEVACSTNPQISNATYGIWVECNHTITYGSIRLIGHDGETNTASGSIREGRLEIFLEGRWGTICAAMFGLREADVACQQLGYHRALWYNRSSSAVLAKNQDSEVYTTPIVLMGVSCTPEDDRIGYCSRHALPEGTTCTHNDDIILACTNDPIATTGAEVTNNSWPLPFSKRFLIEISIGAGLGLILCCCCLVVWCTYCCCQCSQRRRRQRHRRSKRKLSQLLLPDNTQELGITRPDDSETTINKQQEIIVLAAQVQDRLKPSPVPCTSPVVPNEGQGRPSNAQNALNALSEGIEPSASTCNNEEEMANTSASLSTAAGLRVEPERGMEMGLEQENEGGRGKERQWVGFSMEPIPEAEEGGGGELEGSTSASCEQEMELAHQQQQQQPPSTVVAATAGADQVEETGQEKTENENEGLGMGMGCTAAMLQNSDATTNLNRPETEI